jgi:hypothetical protein
VIKTGLVEPNLQPFEHPGFDIPGAAARARRRQIAAVPGNAADPLPFATVPTEGAVDFTTPFETNQGRHDLDLELVRDGEHRVVDAPRHRLGERGIILRVDGQGVVPGQLAEYRRRHHAGGAVALYNCHQPVPREVVRHRRPAL